MFPVFLEMDTKLTNRTHALFDAPPASSRSDKVLFGIRPVLNHDLPNLVLALQGLLQLLHAEEKGRLTPQGQDYLGRLQGIAVQMQTTLTLLKQINKVMPPADSLRSVSLKEALREATAVVKHGFSVQAVPTFGDVPDVSLLAHPALFLQALVHLLSLLGRGRTRDGLDWRVSSRERGSWIELVFHEGTSPKKLPAPGPEGAPAFSSGKPVPAEEWSFDILGPENRLRLVLVDQLLSACGGRLLIQAGPGGTCFELHLPSPESGSLDP